MVFIHTPANGSLICSESLEKNIKPWLAELLEVGNLEKGPGEVIVHAMKVKMRHARPSSVETIQREVRVREGDKHRRRVRAGPINLSAPDFFAAVVVAWTRAR